MKNTEIYVCIFLHTYEWSNFKAEQFLIKSLKWACLCLNKWCINALYTHSINNILKWPINNFIMLEQVNYKYICIYTHVYVVIFYLWRNIIISFTNSVYWAAFFIGFEINFFNLRTFIHLTRYFPPNYKTSKKKPICCSKHSVIIFLQHACRHSQGAQRLINEPFIWYSNNQI